MEGAAGSSVRRDQELENLGIEPGRGLIISNQLVLIVALQLGGGLRIQDGLSKSIATEVSTNQQKKRYQQKEERKAEEPAKNGALPIGGKRDDRSG